MRLWRRRQRSTIISAWVDSRRWRIGAEVRRTAVTWVGTSSADGTATAGLGGGKALSGIGWCGTTCWTVGAETWTTAGTTRFEAVEGFLEIGDVPLGLTNLRFCLTDDVGIAGSCYEGLVAFHDATLGLDSLVHLGDLGFGWVLSKGKRWRRKSAGLIRTIRFGATARRDGRLEARSRILTAMMIVTDGKGARTTRKQKGWLAVVSLCAVEPVW